MTKVNGEKHKEKSKNMIKSSNKNNKKIIKNKISLNYKNLQYDINSQS